jgi:hypothetical protein
MHVDGACHCGQATYQAELDPAGILICHCTDCQTLSGSAFRTVALTRPGGFRLLTGRLTTYLKTAESGRQREQGFCPTCGSPIYSTTPDAAEPKVYAIRVGTCRQRADLAPVGQIWAHSALPWLPDLPAVPARPRD